MVSPLFVGFAILSPALSSSMTPHGHKVYSTAPNASARMTDSCLFQKKRESDHVCFSELITGIKPYPNVSSPYFRGINPCLPPQKAASKAENGSFAQFPSGFCQEKMKSDRIFYPAYIAIRFHPNLFHKKLRLPPVAGPDASGCRTYLPESSLTEDYILDVSPENLPENVPFQRRITPEKPCWKLFFQPFQRKIKNPYLIFSHPTSPLLSILFTILPAIRQREKRE